MGGDGEHMSRCSQERAKSKNNRYENEEIVKLSEKQNKMRGQIDTTQNKKQSKEKKRAKQYLEWNQRTDKEGKRKG